MPQEHKSLDPQNWDSLRDLGHQMLDDMFEYLQTRHDDIVWQPIPQDVQNHFTSAIPENGEDEADVYQEFTEKIQPYMLGNTHPRFWGWVVGTGTPLAMLAEMIAGGINLQMGGGDSSGVHVEMQVLNWCKQMFDYPETASGLLVSGASMANLVGLTVARNVKAPFDVRKEGLQQNQPRMIAYASEEVHSCHQKNMEVLGLGHDSLRFIPVNDEFQMDIQALEKAIADDKAAGNLPFCIIGSAGTVRTGAFDDLEALVAIRDRENMWLHIDGAFGAFAKFVPDLAHLVEAMKKADSLAFDMHKWMSLPFEVGCVLVQNQQAHYETFTLTPDYLDHGTRGAGAAPIWLSDYGLQLSRNFRALKVWMSIKAHGLNHYKEVIQQNIQQTRYFANLVDEHPQLERTASVPLNIVCFRFVSDELSDEQLNTLNQELLLRLQESGVAIVSNSTLQGKYSLRMAHVNHRSLESDFDLLVKTVVELGQTLVQEIKETV